MRNSLIVSGLMAAAFAFAPLAFAGSPTASASPRAHATSHHRHWHHHGHHMHRRHHHRSLLHKLDLSKSQRKNIRQWKHENFQSARAQRKTLHDKRLALKKATPGTDAYQSAANDLARASGQAASQRVMRMAKLRTQIHDALTADQRTKLAKLKTRRQARMQKWRKHRMHRKHAPASAASSR